MKYAALDFEFNAVSEPNLNLVSLSVDAYDGEYLTHQRDFWLHDSPKEQASARDFLKHLHDKGYVFVSFVLEAEYRSMLSFQGDISWVHQAKGIDLYLEYRCLLNHCHSLEYGKQYISGKEVNTTPPPPKWERLDSEEEDDSLHHKPQYSLAAATYKLLNVKIDSEEKEAARAIIIRSDKKEIEDNRERILKYNRSDIQYLPRLLKAVIKVHEIHALGMPYREDFFKAAFLRGEYALATARMLKLGYPVDMERLNKFSANIQSILNSAIEACNEAEPDLKPFRWNKKQNKWIATEKVIREWIAKQSLPHWRRTDGKRLSISKDAFGDWYKDHSPGFAGAYYRYLSTKQSLNGFLPSTTSKKKKFKEFVGTDNRVRPFFGIYGSQSSRSQPAASGYIPLKAYWMRSFIEAEKGNALCSLDYSSQEFLISAIVSQDDEMIKAYESGDVYLAFAKTAGLVPSDATKKSHKKMRDVCKALVLGISYDMTAKGLAPRLTQVSGEEVTEKTAEHYIELFFDAYSDFADWKKETMGEYQDNNRLTLPDGWTMWGDNDNHRSVGNFPIQGAGAVIMRTAVKAAQKVGLKVVYTLHDALTIEYPSHQFQHIAALYTCMSRAFDAVMKTYGKISPIRIEGETWSKDYDGSEIIPTKDVKSLRINIDERGKLDYERYSVYFS